MSKERKVLKGKAVKTGRYHVVAKVNDRTVYTTLIAAADKFKAAVIFHKRAVAGKLTDFGIKPSMTVKTLKVEYYPVRSAVLAEMIGTQNGINSKYFPPHTLN